MGRDTTGSDEDQGGRAVTLWKKHPDSVPLDPLVWWWRDMTKAIEIPVTTNPMADIAARRLASAYWKHGTLPPDPKECAKLIGLDPRTVTKAGAAEDTISAGSLLRIAQAGGSA
jgi:hypothetical protein